MSDKFHFICPACESDVYGDYVCNYCNGNGRVSPLHLLRWHTLGFNPVAMYELWRDMPTSVYKLKLKIARLLVEYAPEDNDHD